MFDKKCFDMYDQKARDKTIKLLGTIIRENGDKYGIECCLMMNIMINMRA